MALIECAECKQTMSTTATSCPHCGAKPKPKPISPNVWGGLALVGLLIAMFIGIGGIRPDPQADAMARDRRVFEACVDEMNDPLRSWSAREAARAVCEHLRSEFRAKYRREP